jgi:hypothetical protein
MKDATLALLAMLVGLTPLWSTAPSAAAPPSRVADQATPLWVGSITQEYTLIPADNTNSIEQWTFKLTKNTDGTTTYEISSYYSNLSWGSPPTGRIIITGTGGGQVSSTCVQDGIEHIPCAQSSADPAQWTFYDPFYTHFPVQNFTCTYPPGSCNQAVQPVVTFFTFSAPGAPDATSLSGSKTDDHSNLNGTITVKSTWSLTRALPAPTPTATPPPLTSCSVTPSGDSRAPAARAAAAAVRPAAPATPTPIQQAHNMENAGIAIGLLGAAACVAPGVPAPGRVAGAIAAMTGLGVWGLGHAKEWMETNVQSQQDALPRGALPGGSTASDSNYTVIPQPATLTLPGFPIAAQGGITPQLANAANAMMSTLAQSLSLEEAMQLGFQRAAAALAAGDAAWVARQTQAAQQYATQAVQLLNTMPGLEADLQSAIAAAGLQQTVTTSQVSDLQAQVRTGGLPAWIADALTALGIDSAGQAQFQQQLLGLDPAAVSALGNGRIPDLFTAPDVTAGWTAQVTGLQSLSTQGPCTARPVVSVSVVPGAANRLQATIQAAHSIWNTTNSVQALRFGAATNATVIAGSQSGPGGFTFTPPAGTAQVSFQVQQQTPGQAATVPLTVVDGCGDWPTFVGGGPQVFAGGNGPGAPGATPNAPPTATPTPRANQAPAPAPAAAATATPTPAAICTPRPSLSVTTAPAEPGRLLVTVTAPAAAHDSLQSLRLGAVTNATIDAGGQTGLRGNTTVPLAPGTQQATFTVTRVTAGQASTVNLTVVDSCGEWSTVVGGGPGAF